ncbi:MAG TPA: DUF4430 domain-containing protein [Gaiellaceae bacterium]
MLHRPLAAVLALVLALVLAACGGDGGGEPSGQAAPAASTQAAETEPAADPTTVLVTTGCGKKVVLGKTEVDPGLTAMQALDSVADVDVDQGGKFVTGIEGIDQNDGKEQYWLFYVNGVAAEKGAAEITLEEGDVEWWDLHDWKKNCEIPADAE